ncbi:small membrane protein [Streptomyces viridochromogenes DSM 40736]|uniref:Small membrane protein n=2 Tax=Streptomyces viridochromogenes TaxID=1938 RepID=D9X0P5_STRVT|nr:small membrane protein [Streptomyces viridochromogenes DSM 40736]
MSDQTPNRRNEERDMKNECGRALTRCLAGAVAVLAVCWLPAGAAHADETSTNSHNGHRFGLANVHVGQIDDPAEDVLEHTLLFGDGYAWN